MEAVDIVEKLGLRDERTLRFSLFTLQKYIKEEQFATVFLERDGLKELVDVISLSRGNTLAVSFPSIALSILIILVRTYCYAKPIGSRVWLEHSRNRIYIQSCTNSCFPKQSHQCMPPSDRYSEKTC